MKHEVLTDSENAPWGACRVGKALKLSLEPWISRACIYNWLAMYRAGGWDALDARKRGGRPRRLKGRMIAWVYRVVVDTDPRQYKFPFALWTRNAIAALIDQRYGIRLSANSVGRLLAQLGITPQKPLWRAYQQDPARVRQWIEEEYPAIAKEAKRLRAESGLPMNRGCAAIIMRGQRGGLRGRPRW